jgi:hypothetical protein
MEKIFRRSAAEWRVLRKRRDERGRRRLLDRLRDDFEIELGIERLIRAHHLNVYAEPGILGQKLR